MLVTSETALQQLGALSGVLLAGILLMLLLELWRTARDIRFSSLSAGADVESDGAGAD